MWEGTFFTEEIPARWNFDASMNFDVPSLKGKIKVGAVNLQEKVTFHTQVEELLVAHTMFNIH